MEQAQRTFEESYKAIREAGGDAYDGVDVEQHLAAVRGQPKGTEARVCDDITERQALGIKKYGKTVEQSDASLRQWLQHAYEEVLDTAVYLRRAIEQMDKTSDNPQYPVVFSPDVAKCKEIILQCMKDFDISYRELSQMCGLPASNIHAMLKGNRRMTKASADAIFKAIK